jgi:pimeloyl-ACP methyl ester carboxylesterase
MEGGDAGVAGARLVEVDTGGATLACIVAGAGPLVILAHGFPDCARSFRLQIPALVAAGYRVVAPWMRGYFPSTTARDGRYDVAALGGDLIALARHFSRGDAAEGARPPARLVGHDWGAIAAYAACALAPRAFSHLVTVAVPHGRVAHRFLRPAQLRRSWYFALFQIRGSAEWLLRHDDFALVDKLWRAWSPGFAPPPDEMAQVKRALHAMANTRAALAYYRAIFSLRRSPRRLLLARTRVPSLYIHGVDDGCVGVELCDHLEPAYAAPVTVSRLPGGHFVHQENAERFNTLLLDHFSRSHP